MARARPPGGGGAGPCASRWASILYGTARPSFSLAQPQEAPHEQDHRRRNRPERVCPGVCRRRRGRAPRPLEDDAPGQGGAARGLRRGPVRHVHPLGPLRHPGGGVEGRADARHRRVDHAAGEDPPGRVRGPGEAVQPGEVRRRRVGADRPRRRDALHGHHLQAPRRLRHVRLRRERLQRGGRHTVRPRRGGRAPRRLQGAGAGVRRLPLPLHRLVRRGGWGLRGLRVGRFRPGR